MTDNPFKNIVASTDNYGRYEYHIFHKCLLPMMEDWGIIFDNAQVIDLGCGSGGGTLAIAEKGANCLGIYRNIGRIKTAKNNIQGMDLQIDYTQMDILRLEDIGQKFDLILLIEVLEHLSTLDNVETILTWCRSHLNSHGRIFISFPPWYNPFAGHQAGWPVIRYIPWYHLMPIPMKYLLAPKSVRKYLEYIKELDKLTIKSFEQIIEKIGLVVIKRALYHIRPEYQWRYNVKPILGHKLFINNRLLKEISTTGAYYLISL